MSADATAAAVAAASLQYFVHPLDKVGDLWNKLAIIEKDFVEKLDGQKDKGVSPELESLKTELLEHISQLKAAPKQET